MDPAHAPQWQEYGVAGIIIIQTLALVFGFLDRQNSKKGGNGDKIQQALQTLAEHSSKTFVAIEHLAEQVQNQAMLNRALYNPDEFKALFERVRDIHKEVIPKGG